MASKEMTWQQWARAVQRDPESRSRIKKGALAALTGTDYKALDAFVPCIRLYQQTGEPRAMRAARDVVMLMQESTRWIAKELIAFVFEWDDRESGRASVRTKPRRHRTSAVTTSSCSNRSSKPAASSSPTTCPKRTASNG